MAITAKDVITLMREAGIDEEIVAKLKFDVPLLSQGMDSIDLPVVAVAAEKKYNIDLSDADAKHLKTINDFVKFVNAKLK
ncbi:MAG: phosphopantetheine-binding protein [Syntrophales bacterium]|nr:phosphopantetheine-binding protein [Syntrophales bacterium]